MSLEEKYESYTQQRAQGKYDGDLGKGFPSKEFRKCVEYLSGIMEKVDFDEEDLADMARMALSRRASAAGA
ncbi:MAG TPA: hypothetical protein VE262_13305 [Blastocatellia bacterium]|nr:hypothetical protein [Blastocatellia bacterium]